MGRLGHVGTAVALRRLLFPNGFGAQVMQIVLDAWSEFRLPSSVHHEEPITALFHKALLVAYAAADKNWFVTLEDPITDPTFGTELGRNDLNFYPLDVPQQSVCFTVECKRLNAPRPPSANAIASALRRGKPAPRFRIKYLAIDYVTEGMQRFVDGLYSRGVPCGGMIGYVLDNNLDSAFSRVCSEIQARRDTLRITTREAHKAPSAVLSKWKHSADTWHERKEGRFLIHHVLLASNGSLLKKAHKPLVHIPNISSKSNS